MREIKYGFFFFLLSKILAVNCLQKNPTDSVQFNGQNAEASNSWPSQPVPQETMNYYNSINPDPQLNFYLNNNGNQQQKYEQQSSMPQPYNGPHPYNTPQYSSPSQHIPTEQQLTPQEQNYFPPTYYQNQQVNTFQPPTTGTPPITQSNPMPQYQSNAPQSIPEGKLDSNNESVKQQTTNMQYSTFNQNENTKQPVINQKNEKQQSQVPPESYNLQPPSEGGQGVSQYFGKIESSPPKEYQKQLPMSSNQPYPQELSDFSQVKNNSKNKENKPVQVSSTIIPQLSQQTSFISKSDIPSNILLPPNENQLDLSQSPPSIIAPISNNLQLSQMPLNSSLKPMDNGSLTLNKNNMEINGGEPFNSQSDVPNNISFSPKLPQSTQDQFDLPQASSSELLNKGPSTPNKNNMEINGGEPFNSQSDVPNNISFSPKLPQSTQNQFGFPQSSPSNPLITNQLPLPQMPLQSSSELIDKGPSTPNTNTMQDTKADVSLNSIQGFLDDKSEALISNVVQNENILIDNSQTDMETFLHPENNDSLNPQNNVSENQDNSKLESNNTLSKEQDVMIIDPEPDDLKKDTNSNNATQTLDNASNDISSIENNEEINLLHSLEHLVFDEPLDYELYKYDTLSTVDMENPENKKQDKDKITVLANPNDIHTQQISPEQSPTSDNSYLNNNYLLNTPTTNIPWYKPSFPSKVDYVQQPDSNANNQLLSLLLNFNQNPMYPPNNNYYNQQDPYPPYGQNQMISKTKIPNLSQNVNQPSSEDTSGYIYKKLDLKNPPPNISNSWLLLNKDYTKNLNQNNAYTNYDGKISTSIFGTPSMSYQNNIQGILNLSSNDMSVQNIISAISNLFNVPMVGTKAIFDLTRVNLPRAPMSQIIRLTHAIVQSAMLSLQQTLNTLYGRRAKQDFNPQPLHKLPGALINKYSEESTAKPTANNINIPYYNQLDATGQRPLADFSANQPMFQQQQMNYGGVTDMNSFGSQNNNNRVAPHPAYIQNYVLSSLEDAITTAIRSSLSDYYSINTPEVNEYIQQVILTVEIVFKNQIDNTIYGLQPTMNIY
ncbi:hypothetical protein QTP88_013845 [Uroleucon formosanum]